MNIVDDSKEIGLKDTLVFLVRYIQVGNQVLGISLRHIRAVVHCNDVSLDRQLVLGELHYCSSLRCLGKHFTSGIPITIADGVVWLHEVFLFLLANGIGLHDSLVVGHRPCWGGYNSVDHGSLNVKGLLESGVVSSEHSYNHLL